MKKYLSFFRIRFIAGLQYRAAAWAGISTQFAWGGLTILMFWAFYQNGDNSFPMTFPELSSYIWLQQAFLAMYMAWFFDGEIFDSITSGNISYELCRPLDKGSPQLLSLILVLFWYFKVFTCTVVILEMVVFHL